MVGGVSRTSYARLAGPLVSPARGAPSVLELEVQLADETHETKKEKGE